MRYFEQAIAIDFEFIPAYHGLGMAYVSEVVDVRVPMAENRAKLRELVGRGLRLAPDDLGLIALSGQLARYDGDIKLAEERFATALQKDPSNSVLRSVYAIFKIDQGYPEESLALNRRARELDPLNPSGYIAVWASYMDLWNAKEAIAAAEHYREIVTPTHPKADGLIAKRGGCSRAILPGASNTTTDSQLRADRAGAHSLGLRCSITTSANCKRPSPSWNADGLREVITARWSLSKLTGISSTAKSRRLGDRLSRR